MGIYYYKLWDMLENRVNREPAPFHSDTYENAKKSDGVHGDDRSDTGISWL